MSAQGVFTPSLRVAFVDGQETASPDVGFVACGAGTAFPMQVTLDQVAEIWYRVKDAWFIAGSQSWTVSSSPASVYAPTTAATNRYVENDLTDAIIRGYTTTGADDYYGALYDNGNGVNCSDISDNERGMWRNVANVRNAFSFRNGGTYNHPNTSDWITTGNADPSFSTGWMDVSFGGRIAVVKTDPANGFYDATNKFFMEVELWWDDYGTPSFGGGTNILNGYWGAVDPANYLEVCNYVIRLSENVDVTCAMYALTGGGADFTAEDWIHAAQEWWPYDRNTEPRQIWDAATGEFVPIGAPVLAFDRDVSDLYLLTF